MNFASLSIVAGSALAVPSAKPSLRAAASSRTSAASNARDRPPRRAGRCRAIGAKARVARALVENRARGRAVLDERKPARGDFPQHRRQGVGALQKAAAKEGRHREIAREARQQPAQVGIRLGRGTPPVAAYAGPDRCARNRSAPSAVGARSRARVRARARHRLRDRCRRARKRRSPPAAAGRCASRVVVAERPSPLIISAIFGAPALAARPATDGRRSATGGCRRRRSLAGRRSSSSRKRADRAPAAGCAAASSTRMMSAPGRGRAAAPRRHARPTLSPLRRRSKPAGGSRGGIEPVTSSRETARGSRRPRLGGRVRDAADAARTAAVRRADKARHSRQRSASRKSVPNPATCPDESLGRRRCAEERSSASKPSGRSNSFMTPARTRHRRAT